jgi:vancomycin permeability regulator SanA
MVPRLLRALALGAVSAALLVVGTNLWVRAEASDHAYASPSQVTSRVVAIVPGADVHRGRPVGTLERRLETAVGLYRAGRVRTILISGNDTPASPEVTAMHTWLRERDVPEPDIWADPSGSRTRETMRNAAETFNVTSAVICTQAAYVDRAVFLARQAGIDAVGVGVPSAASRSVRGRSVEAIKTTVAFLESYLRGGSGSERAKTVVALR